MIDDDEYDLLDRDPRTIADFAYLDAFIGLTPPATPAMSEQRFDDLFGRAVLMAANERARQRQRSRGRRRTFFRAVAAALTVAALAGVAVSIAVLRNPPPAYAATPAPLAITATPSPGDVTLAGLAALARRGPGTSDTGPVDHVVVDRWELNSDIDGRTVTSAVIPFRREVWRTDREQARTVVTYQPPQFPTDADRRAWQKDGSPEGGKHVEDYAAGTYPYALPYRMPTDPGRLAAWLAGSSSGRTAILSGTRDLLSDRALTSAQLSTLLSALATDSGLAYAGTTVDRAGRPGLAFTVASTDSGAQTTEVFVISPSTGRILATETILTGGAPALKVRLPAVISYRTYLTSEHVPAFPR